MRIIEGLEAAKSLLLERSPVELAGDARSETVRQILQNVRAGGDRALLDYSEKIDGVRLNRLEVPQQEVVASRDKVSKELLDALEFAAERIRSFHETQKRNLGLEFFEGGLGFVVRSLERVGIYVPGGKASYPSTVLMTAIPASVAGVGEVIMTTPPAPDGSLPAPTLAAASVAKVDRIFKLGGAQAIAAMAYGTESVPKVDKICGPGNIFVTLAKKQVFGTVAIDGLYGPTETVILADDSANPVFCAADLIAQAEHDEMASAVLITASTGLADAVREEIERQLAGMEREPIVRRALESNGALVVVAGIDEVVELVNLYAPEHLCLMLRNARSYIDRIRHAGGIFVGAPEALGDYTAGPSHVMPTGGTARFSSPLSVLDFLKLSLLVELDDGALQELGPASAAIARAEGLQGHALSVERRLEEMEKEERGE
ncbi:MAG TPA: histidinol dehydrogenase [Dehalococcoidia bacterium]|nr:histidinol dehydrogenase [Dehalococcoidia bacterium]